MPKSRQTDSVPTNGPAYSASGSATTATEHDEPEFTLF